MKNEIDRHRIEDLMKSVVDQAKFIKTNIESPAMTDLLLRKELLLLVGFVNEARRTADV